MKILSEKIRTVAVVTLFSLGLGMGACSTGTDAGETNVEESDAKDKNPDEHNVETDMQPRSVDTVDMDNAYEKTDGDKGAHDRDNNGLVDEPQ